MSAGLLAEPSPRPLNRTGRECLSPEQRGRDDTAPHSCPPSDASGGGCREPHRCREGTYAPVAALATAFLKRPQPVPDVEVAGQEPTTLPDWLPFLPPPVSWAPRRRKVADVDLRFAREFLPHLLMRCYHDEALPWNPKINHTTVRSAKGFLCSANGFLCYHGPKTHHKYGSIAEPNQLVETVDADFTRGGWEGVADLPENPDDERPGGARFATVAEDGRFTEGGAEQLDPDEDGPVLTYFPELNSP